MISLQILKKNLVLFITDLLNKTYPEDEINNFFSPIKQNIPFYEILKFASFS